MADLPIPRNARDVGQCIYCGAKDQGLSKEHALPYGLNGPWTLLRASCNQCAAITHRFERDSLKGLWPMIRNVLAMQSRRPWARPDMLPLVLESKGARRTVLVPPRDFPLYLPMPVLQPPGAVSGNTHASEMSAKLSFIHLTGPSFEEVGRREGADFVGARLIFSPEEFSRMLAKIAFCAGIFAMGLAPFTSSPIRDVILGKDRRVGHWVGSWGGEPMNEANGLHSMRIRASGSDIHVFLRLFAQFGAPEYHVVLGPADPEFVRSDAWPWK